MQYATQKMPFIHIVNVSITNISLVSMLFYILMALHIVVLQASIAHAKQENQAMQNQQSILWQDIHKGLSIATFDLSTTPRNPNESQKDINISSKRPALVAIRIAPKYWEFSVHCASNNNKKALSLQEWAKQEDLTVAINASMYLPDGLTSTGYLQTRDHVNNRRIGSRLGAFFVAEPYSKSLLVPTNQTHHKSDIHKALPLGALPLGALLDKYTDPYESLIPLYRVVVQNFRLISPDRRILWDAGGARHSITAVGQDGQGNILFLHCAKPMTPHEFAAVLLAFPLDIRNTMYVEGGPESALLLRTPEATHVWIGKLRPELLGFGNSNIPLPNIIGVRPRQ